MARTQTFMDPTFPARHHHTGVRPVSAGPALCKEARGLVEWAVRERQRAIRGCWSKVPHAFVQEQMRPLETWLRHNLHPGAGTILLLLHERFPAIRTVMPGTVGGANKLKRLARIQELLRE